MKIGVLGAGGRAGKGTLEVLKKKHCDILAGYRNVEKISDVATMTVDVNEPELLSTFINSCDLVINCTGPAHKLGDTVAFSCTKADKGLIDVAGNDFMVREVMENCGNKGRILLSAGVYPGLVELLFKMGTEMTKVKSSCIEEIFFDYSNLSENALLDIKASLDDGEGKGFSYWKNAAVCSIDCQVKEKIVLSNGKIVYLLPMFYKEYQVLCEKIKPHKVFFFQGFADAKDIEKLIKLKEVFERKDGENGFLILLDFYSNENELTRFQIESSYDSAFLSGAVAAMIAMTGGNALKNGVHYAAEIEDATSVIKGLKELGLITIKKYRSRNLNGNKKD